MAITEEEHESRKEILSKAITALAFKKQDTRNFYRKGDKVEIASQEYGYIGAYYTATIISSIGNSHYRVKYQDLLSDDKSGNLLEETVRANEVRPVPPEHDVLQENIRLYNVVDVFADDGWWIGFISGKEGSKYDVYFPTTGDEVAYPPQLLRFHQEWVNGNWISFKKN